VQTRRNAHSAINKKSIFLGGKTSHVSPVRYYAVKANDIPSVATYISQIITNAAKKAYPSMANSTLVTSFRVLSTKADGDYAAHIALPLAQELSLSPVEVAENILKNIEPSEVVGEITTHKGFLNVHLSDDWLAKNIVTKQIVDRKATREKKRLLIDYASPNMGKELHVGHLRSIMVGDCLQRIFTHQGHDVMKVSHVGDFGTPMGQVLASALHEKDPWFVKLMSQSEVKPANWQDIPESEWPSIHRLYQLYVAAKKNAGEEFVKNSTKFLHAIQKPNGDWRVKRGWEILCEVSRRAFNELYEKLGVSVEEYGESRYAPLLPKVFEMLQNKVKSSAKVYDKSNTLQGIIN
jgi:arginyl-tRNA synthetase